MDVGSIVMQVMVCVSVVAPPMDFDVPELFVVARVEAALWPVVAR